MQNATLRQAKKVLELIDQANLSTEQLQELIPYLSDVMQLDTNKIKRNAFRKACGLRPIEKNFRLREVFTLEDLILDSGESIGDRIVKSISSKGAECHFSSNHFGSDGRLNRNFGYIVSNKDCSVVGDIIVDNSGAGVKRLIIKLSGFEFKDTYQIKKNLERAILKIANQLD